MRYIRTKDGRILRVFEDNVGLFNKNDGLAYYGENTVDFETSCFLPKSEVIKQADTIEELCDGYLCSTQSGKNWVITENYETAKLYAERGCKVNGCILNDKGLIYVAKMNEKGELELLWLW